MEHSVEHEIKSQSSTNTLFAKVSGHVDGSKKSDSNLNTGNETELQMSKNINYKTSGNNNIQDSSLMGYIYDSSTDVFDIDDELELATSSSLTTNLNDRQEQISVADTTGKILAVDSLNLFTDNAFERAAVFDSSQYRSISDTSEQAHKVIHSSKGSIPEEYKSISKTLPQLDSFAHFNSNSGDSILPSDENIVSNFKHTIIISAQIPKLNYGGYHNKKTDICYENAVAQTTTAYEIRDNNSPLKFHRDCQTAYCDDVTTQVPNSVATQMETQFLYLNGSLDKILYSKPYRTADELQSEYLRKVVLIQCVVRCFLAKLSANKLRINIQINQRKIEENIKWVARDEEVKRQKAIERRLHPKTRKDFEVIYNGLEDWKIKQLDKLKDKILIPEQRKVFLVDLINTEASLIQKIDAMKVEIGRQNHENKMLNLVDKMAESKKWQTNARVSEAVDVDTPDILRARYLKGIYLELKSDEKDHDARLSTLLKVKKVAKEFDCILCRELIDLVDREGDLMTRGRPLSSLTGLRLRIRHLYFQFIRNPEFNPISKLHNNNARYKKIDTIYYCKGCSQYLGATKFGINSTKKQLGRCKACHEKEEIFTRERSEQIYPKLILKARRDEKRKALDGTKALKFVDLLQEKDLRYLVETIWEGKSAISGFNSLSKLTVCRWDIKKELTPWNLILVTELEQKNHFESSKSGLQYSDDFLKVVHARHERAKLYFSERADYSNILHL